MSVAEAELLDKAAALSDNPQDFVLNPWQPALGAVVKGLRYSGGALPDATRVPLRKALLEHGLLTFEPGTVTGQNFTEFLETFGEVVLYSGPLTPAVSAETQANIVDSTDKRVARNYIWHIDQAFRPNPPNYTALFGKAVPEFGGDTLFSNAVLAYERLDPLFAAYLETLTAVHYWDAC